MYAIGQALTNDEPQLPIFSPFDFAGGAELMHGQTVMVAAPPGGYKSALIQSICQYRGHRSEPSGASESGKNSVLYFSADSSKRTMAVRAGQMAGLGDRQQIRELYNSSNSEALAQVSQDTESIKWVFRPEIWWGDIEVELTSWWHMHMDFPDVIVIDNLTNMMPDSGSNPLEASGQEENLQFLTLVARYTGACVLVTHHVVGDFINAEGGLPQSAIKNKIDRVVETVITINLGASGVDEKVHKKTGAVVESRDWKELLVAFVKNRDGSSDKSGKTFTRVKVVPDIMKFEQIGE